MPRKKSTKPARGGRRGGKGGGNPALKYILIGGGVIAAGFLIWFIVMAIIGTHNYSRESLDKYVTLTDERSSELAEGAGIYVDMSDGMNFAYSSDESRNVLKAVINKLAAIKGVDFFGLAEGQIAPLSENHTTLYNYMLNAANYQKQQAPIEKALDQILAKNQPALLMTDFEEYNGGIIQKAAYAKRAFIEWLGKGNNITFYKWDFEEKGKEKHMYLAVFDNNAGRLKDLVAQAVEGVNDNDIDRFVLASRDFSFPLYSTYEGVNLGGNYHNSEGVDIVTAIPDQDGGDESFYSYFNLVAEASGGGKFAPLDTFVGVPAEFYPLGVPWSDALANAKAMQEPGVSKADRFEHLLSRLYVDFKAQSGYNITGVEIRAFDIQGTLDSIGALDKKALENAGEKLKALPTKEVAEFLTVTTRTVEPFDYEEILVDFHPRFNGTLQGVNAQSDVVRANVVISRTQLDTEEIYDFFSWSDNKSLAESVKNALESPVCDFSGRILFTYYFRAPEKK